MWIQSSTEYKHLCSQTKFKVLETFINVPQALKHILWKEMNLIEKVLGQEFGSLSTGSPRSLAWNVNLGMARNPFSPSMKWRGICKWFQKPPSPILPVYNWRKPMPWDLVGRNEHRPWVRRPGLLLSLLGNFHISSTPALQDWQEVSTHPSPYITELPFPLGLVALFRYDITENKGPLEAESASRWRVPSWCVPCRGKQSPFCLTRPTFWFQIFGSATCPF